ncbi:MAG TPA: CheR family methyltransferase, partial [Rectinemataceae bacterium]|nr:CheR family methyltransferase [Rectinemataceae bacterium]
MVERRGKAAEHDRARPASDPVSGGLSEQDFRRLARYIESELGIRMPETKRVMLEARLQKRVRKLGFPGFEGYVDYVFSRDGREAELINMIDAVTTNKTDFFREADHFDFLIDTILPETARAQGGSPLRPLKVWSAGCSTGEEPYTLAMVLEEHRSVVPDFRYQILATDLSSQVLDQAVSAVYDESKAETVPLSFKKKYMLRSKDHDKALVRMKPEIRSRVRFARLNFMDEHYGVETDFDVIFCRNVIIYFERPVQERIL